MRDFPCPAVWSHWHISAVQQMCVCIACGFHPLENLICEFRKQNSASSALLEILPLCSSNTKWAENSNIDCNCYLWHLGLYKLGFFLTFWKRTYFSGNTLYFVWISNNFYSIILNVCWLVCFFLHMISNITCSSQRWTLSTEFGLQF